MSYKNHPFSLFLKIVVYGAAIITAFILFSLIAYILIKGIPNITSELLDVYKRQVQRISSTLLEFQRLTVLDADHV